MDSDIQNYKFVYAIEITDWDHTAFVHKDFVVVYYFNKFTNLPTLTLVLELILQEHLKIAAINQK